ncbi:MAG TPA: hypothetical protein VGK79_03225 [Gaiellaceae bacterium]
MLTRTAVPYAEISVQSTIDSSDAPICEPTFRERTVSPVTPP